VDTRRSIGDQDRWADAAQHGDVKAAAAVAALGADAGSSKDALGPKPTATAAAAAFTAAAAAAAAAAVGGALRHADALKEGSSPGSAGQGSADKKASRTAGKGAAAHEVDSMTWYAAHQLQCCVDSCLMLSAENSAQSL
jgi:hypothetical protein